MPDAGLAIFDMRQQDSGDDLNCRQKGSLALFHPAVDPGDRRRHRVGSVAAPGAALLIFDSVRRKWGTTLRRGAAILDIRSRNL